MIAIRVGVFAVLLVLVPTRLLARQVVLEIDHHSGNATLRLPCKDTPLKFGEDAWVHPSDDIEIRVINTNTALYTYKLTQEKVPATEIETLKLGLASVRLYLTDLLTTEERSSLVPGDDPVIVRLKKLDEALNGDDGLRQRYFDTIAALESMRQGSVEGVAAEFDAKVRTARFLGSPRQVAAALDSLRKAVAECHDAKICEKGQGVIDKSEAILASAYAVERLAIAAANAKGTWSSKKAGKDIDVTASEGRKIKITVAAKDVAELKRLADREPLEVDVKLNPDWPVQVSVGATLLMSQQSRFDRFASQARPDSTFQVVKSGSQDSRYTYGVSLGFTLRCLNWRESGWALWPLVITVNPSDDIKAIGLGSAVSWRPLRLHAGWLFTKHAELDGSKPGDVQATGNVVTRDTYGDGKFFVGLGVSLWKVGD